MRENPNSSEEKQARAVTKSLGLCIHGVAYLANDYLHDDHVDGVVNVNVNAEVAINIGAPAEVVLHAATPTRIPH